MVGEVAARSHIGFGHGAQAQAPECLERLLEARVGVASRDTLAVRVRKTDQLPHRARGLSCLCGIHCSRCRAQLHLGLHTLRADLLAIVARVRCTLQKLVIGGRRLRRHLVWVMVRVRPRVRVRVGLGLGLGCAGPWLGLVFGCISTSNPSRCIMCDVCQPGRPQS